MENRRVKVCHFTSVHPANDVRIFEKMCTSLAQAGYDVYLVAPGESFEKNGVKVVGVGAQPLSRIKRMTGWAKKVYKRALEVDASIYHFHDPELLPYGLKLKKKGKTVIYDSHENLPLQLMTKSWISPRLRKMVSYIVRRIEDYYANRMSAVIVVSEPIFRRFLPINKKTIEICNYPLIQEFSTPADWQAKFPELCYVGGIFRERGIFEMLIMVGKTHSTLHLAGKFSPAGLENEVKAQSGWQYVDYHGFVDRQGVIDILNRVKIGIMLLHKYESYAESLPVKLFEYMAAGLPVVVSDFPLWKSIVEGAGCGLCVNPYNAQEVADAVRYLLSHDEIAETMGKNGRKAVLEKYNWNKEKEKLLKLYEDILDK